MRFLADKFYVHGHEFGVIKPRRFITVCICSNSQHGLMLRVMIDRHISSHVTTTNRVCMEPEFPFFLKKKTPQNSVLCRGGTRPTSSLRRAPLLTALDSASLPPVLSPPRLHQSPGSTTAPPLPTSHGGAGHGDHTRSSSRGAALL